MEVRVAEARAAGAMEVVTVAEETEALGIRRSAVVVAAGLAAVVWTDWYLFT